MTQSCRDVILDVWAEGSSPIGTNAGLLRDRYLEISVKDDRHKDARERLQEAIREAVLYSGDVYSLAYANNSASIQTPKKEDIFKTSGRMVIGLGSENVLETGIFLQHTYGTPLIPGSALKGLAAHYCNQVYGEIDPRFKLGGDYHETIFGTTEDSGHIIFHDAWITPEGLTESLKPDVMTPHHSDYYSKKDDAAPTDFDDPKPITLLSISGSFHVAVSCDVSNGDGKKWTDLAFKILTEALKDWGVGGKTNAGYGRLIPENLDQISRKPVAETDDSKFVAPSQEVQKPKYQHRTASKTLRYKKGDIVEVTKAQDPKEKRGWPYFIADDGVGGLVVLGTPPSVEIGQKTRLEINGVMEKEGLYNFAAVGAKKEPRRQSKDRRGRR
ncbi:MAG: type III-B CRISPR module RAMP protein Cmr6 [Methanotrichaceae archaeon]|nr:type III-B CRISPR module RAMP protein Cmr6 [Methanotrichaceae archaeon]